jgi:LPXTG-motif cell wall-anchored protein
VIAATVVAGIAAVTVVGVLLARRKQNHSDY